MKGYSAMLLCLAIIPFVGCTTDGVTGAGVATPSPAPAPPITPAYVVPDPSKDKLNLEAILDYLYGVSRVSGFPKRVNETIFIPLTEKFGLGPDYGNMKDALSAVIIQAVRIREFLLKPEYVTTKSTGVPKDVDSISIKTVFKLFPLLQIELSEFSTKSVKWIKELSQFDNTPLTSTVNSGSSGIWLKEHGFTHAELSETALLLDAMDKVGIFIAPTGSFNKVLRFYTITSMLTPYDASHAVLSLYMLTSPIRMRYALKMRLENQAEELFPEKGEEILETMNTLANLTATLANVVAEPEDVAGTDGVLKTIFDLDRFLNDQGGNYFNHLGRLCRETLPELQEMDKALQSMNSVLDEQTAYLSQKGFNANIKGSVDLAVEKIHKLSSENGPISKLVGLLKSVTPKSDGSSFSPIGLSAVLTCVVVAIMA